MSLNAKVSLTEGWTGQIPWVLMFTPPGATSTERAIDLTGKVVTLILRDRDKKLVPVATTSSSQELLIPVGGSTGGLVTYNPSSTNDLLAARGPYTGRFKVLDAAGKSIYCPSGLADIWDVHTA